MTLFRDWIVAEAADAAHAPPDAAAARGLSTENVGNDVDILGTSGLTR
jgi:LysR family transcriptional regulator of beta-lactamase